MECLTKGTRWLTPPDPSLDVQPCAINQSFNSSGFATCKSSSGASQPTGCNRNPSILKRLLPFTGSFRGCSWNSRAWLCNKPILHHNKHTYISKLLKDHDFVGVQETHSSAGKIRGLASFENATCFWSHGSARIGGIALIVKHDFLAQFESRTWTEIEVGRSAILKLDGSAGSFDL
eukprot:11703944-Karenia_brevis.AAC.1